MQLLKDYIVYLAGCIAVSVFMWFIFFSARPFYKSVIANFGPSETKVINIYSGSGWAESNDINKLLDKGWRLRYTVMDGCGNLSLEFER